MRKSVVCLSLLIAWAGAAGHASADPLTLNALSIYTIDLEDHSFRFAGDSFDFQQAGLTAAFSAPFTADGDLCFPPCRAGDVLRGTLRTEGEVDLSHGQGVIDGVLFPSLTFRGSLAFSIGPFVLSNPPNSSDVLFEIAPPFEFQSLFRAFDGDVQVFAHELRGSGEFVVPFVRNDDNTLSPAEDQDNFVFASPAAPTPEPATLLLVGGGALALARRHLRQKWVRDRGWSSLLH